MKVDLACGERTPDGFAGVDIRPLPGVRVVADLFRPLPFATASIEEVRCEHFVEHVPDLIGFMDELYRILEPGGTALIVHPYQFATEAWQDPTHVRALNERSWLYYCKEWREESGLGHYPIRADFTVDEVELVPRFPDRPLPENWAFLNNVITELRVHLRKLPLTSASPVLP